MRALPPLRALRQVEILFSPGAAYNPVETVPLKKDHVLPVMPRVPIHCGGALRTLRMLCVLCMPVHAMHLLRAHELPAGLPARAEGKKQGRTAQ